ncbi:MAG: hypothetical protein ACREGE_03560 [Candidatus Microsaccharimonas sp.]
MKTYTLKSAIRRGSLLSAAFALVVATFVPFASTHADALNPLTDRSLTLSSSAPGWDYLDGSGNTTYAMPNSGANGQKTGNTFSFKVSSNTTTTPDPLTEPIRAMTFQYCTQPAGDCIAPGNNGYTAGAAIPNSQTTTDAKKSDLEVIVNGTQTEAPFTHINATSGLVTSIPDRALPGSNYIVYYKDGATWVQSSGWTMAVANTQDGVAADSENTGKMNQINLTNTTGQGFTAGQEVKVVFFATDGNYITNPGDGAFFVKINTYNNATTFNDTTLVDGGVTVANVMNEGIQITTKVLETMDFSVGTVDPYTLEATGSAGSQLEERTGNVVHGTCDPILQGGISDGQGGTLPISNTLQLGSETGEFSLETAHTYSTHSYWRLSSNSSAGATVYYSGVTLKNTVGDEITAIGNGTGTATALSRGSEQFGLAMALNNNDTDLPVSYKIEREAPVEPDESNPTYGLFENGADNQAAGLADALNAGIHSSVTDDLISNADSNASWHSPQLAPLAPRAAYANGAGVDGQGNINPEYGSTAGSTFAFDTNSNTIPTPFASGTDVVDCVTGKMRYVANIAATTPAGIYTTKINYIAAPQY